MARRFVFYRSSIPALARQGAMQRAMKERADRTANAAAGASAQAKIEVAPVVTTLAGMDRAGQRVQDVGVKAVDREFGNPHRPGARVLGRLSTKGGRT